MTRQQMKNSGWIATVALTAWLAGCATQKPAEAPPVEDKTKPAVTAPAAQPAPTQPAELSAAEKRRQELLAQKRVHFAFDSSTIDDEARQVIEAHAAYLTANPNLKVKLEGHCDERGTREYNLALGERRAQAVEKMMKLLGVTANRLSNSSYGEEKPLDPEHNESAWRQNRRVEIIY
jgi:peptidoglycan-associated lipoprotein